MAETAGTPQADSPPPPADAVQPPPKPPEKAPAPAAAKAKKSPKKRPRAPKPATILISSSPSGASVFWKGKRICRSTPCKKKLPASKGGLTVTFRKKGYVAAEVKTNVAPGKTAKAHAKLIRRISEGAW